MAVKRTHIITSLLVLSSVAVFAAIEAPEPDSSQFAELKNQYATWKQTAESDTIVDVLEQDPNLVVLWAGYGFAKDYNQARGHA
jgi:nitrite reductase (cytochrome c-552)